MPSEDLAGIEYRLGKLLDEHLQEAVDALIDFYPGVDVDSDEQNPADFIYKGKKYIVYWRVEEYEQGSQQIG